MQITLKARFATSKNGSAGSDILGWTYNITDAPLTGTNRQIVWAETIRAASIEDFVNAIAFSQARLADGSWLKNKTHMTAEVEAMVAKINAMIAERLTPTLATVTSAQAWIEAANGAKNMSTVKVIIRTGQNRELSQRGLPNV